MTTAAHDSVLGLIGDTSLVELRSVVPAGAARVFVKVESENPTGSMKDRVALAMIEAAQKDGRLKPGGGVVEYTGGSTGTSLALVCAAKGHPLWLVTSDAFSREKRDHMTALGAKLTVVPSEGGLATRQLFENMVEQARRIAGETGAYWTDQLRNTDSHQGYFPLGREIWEQTGGRVDAFVQSVGTSHSLRGVAAVLKRFNPEVKVIAVEPKESSVLRGGPGGAHGIEGIGIGFAPPSWDPKLVDHIDAVSTADAKEMARRLAREEGLFAGTSSGANVTAAIRAAEKLGAGAVIVTLLIDSGMKYLSTDVFRGQA